MDSFGSEEEYEEAEIWGVMMNHSREDNSKTHIIKGSSSLSSNAWGLKATPMSIIPRATLHEAAPPTHSSLPLDIPNWSTVLKKKKKKKKKKRGNDDDHVYDDSHDHHDDDDGEMVPPHEYLAKKLARTQIASYSMCEGVGRTLKGRDLSRLRNTILSKTGFLE